MYTLKVESCNQEFLKSAQALVQENKYWCYEIVIGPYEQTSVSLSTMNLRELKRLVDLLESEQFMGYED